MKNIIIYSIILFTFCLESNAQITGGGAINSMTPAPQPSPQNTNQDINSYGFVGYAKPIGNFSLAIEDSEGDNLNGNMSGGFGLYMGQIFNLNQIKLPEKLKLGIDWTYVGMNMSLSPHALAEDQEDYMMSATVGMGVGPHLTFSPTNNLNLSAKFSLNPSFFYYSLTYDDEEYESYSYMTRYCFGIYAGNSKLVFGVTWDYGSKDDMLFTSDYEDDLNYSFEANYITFTIGGYF